MPVVGYNLSLRLFVLSLLLGKIPGIVFGGIGTVFLVVLVLLFCMRSYFHKMT